MSSQPTPAERLAARKGRKPKAAAFIPTWDCQLRTERKRLGLTLADVAEQSGVSRATIWNMEHGRDPGLSSALKISVFFGMPILQLWPKLLED